MRRYCLSRFVLRPKPCPAFFFDSLGGGGELCGELRASLVNRSNLAAFLSLLTFCGIIAPLSIDLEALVEKVEEEEKGRLEGKNSSV